MRDLRPCVFAAFLVCILSATHLGAQHFDPRERFEGAGPRPVERACAVVADEKPGLAKLPCGSAKQRDSGRGGLNTLRRERRLCVQRRGRLGRPALNGVICASC